MPIEFTKDLITGVKEIDDEHRELFNRINKLFEAGMQGKGQEEALNMFNYLEDYVLLHFETEEKYMKKYLYRRFLSHQKSHAQFLKTVGEFRKQLESGINSRLVVQINRAVIDWFMTHYRSEDKILAEFLITRID